MLLHSSDADMGRSFQSDRAAGAKIWGFPTASSPLSIRTSRPVTDDDDASEVDEEESTTPTARDARIPDRLPCPPPPRKKRSPPGCAHTGTAAASGREFFRCPPDLEAVFTRRRPQPAK